jgi:hypothetical protein
MPITGNHAFGISLKKVRSFGRININVFLINLDANRFLLFSPLNADLFFYCFFKRATFKESKLIRF